MIPCSSANSQTIWVSRSALARSAASSTRARKPRVADGRLDAAGDPGREFPETHDLLVGGPQEGVEDDLLEALHAVLEGDLPVLLEEEPRIGEAGADHLLVSPPDDRRIAGQGVVDRQKVGQELPSPSTTGKYFWWEIIVVIRTSWGSFRYSESKLPQTTVGYSVRKATVRAVPRDGSALPPTAAAAFSVSSRMISFRSSGSTMTKCVRVWARYSSELRTGKGAGAHEAVAAAHVAAFEVSDPEGDDPAAVEGEDPVDRPGEAELQVRPAHRLAEGDVGDELSSGSPGGALRSPRR